MCIGLRENGRVASRRRFYFKRGCIESVERGIKLNLYYRTSILNGISMRWTCFIIFDLWLE